MRGTLSTQQTTTDVALWISRSQPLTATSQPTFSRKLSGACVVDLLKGARAQHPPPPGIKMSKLTKCVSRRPFPWSRDRLPWPPHRVTLSVHSSRLRAPVGALASLPRSRKPLHPRASFSQILTTSRLVAIVSNNCMRYTPVSCRLPRRTRRAAPRA